MNNTVSDSSITDTAAAVAVVVRATPKDFILIRQEWAAIRIQALFRAFLVTISFPCFEYCSSHSVLV